jgi:hypothetical protein
MADTSLSCNAGSFLIRQPYLTALEYNRQFSCEAGSFTLTGADATLLEAAGHMVASAGELALTGQDITLTFVEIHSLNCETGVLGITTPTSNFTHHSHVHSTGVATITVTLYAN